MGLYVDNLRIPYGRMKMCHMIADTAEELREAATILGLSQYMQYAGTWKEHLDVSLSKRKEAINHLGAQEVSAKDIVAIMRQRRFP